MTEPCVHSVHIEDGVTIPTRAIYDHDIDCKALGLLCYIAFVCEHRMDMREANINTLRNRTGYTRQTIFRLLSDLIDRRYIVRKGNGKFTHYVVDYENFHYVKKIDRMNGNSQNLYDTDRKGETENKEENREKSTKRENKEETRDRESKDTILSAEPLVSTNIYYDYDIRNPIENKDYSMDLVSEEPFDISKVAKEEETGRYWTCKDIVGYLNEKTGKHFQYKCAATREHINARIKEGFTPEDFRSVIDFKVKEWRGTAMEKYLRPETLFSRKFDRYLNEIPNADDNDVLREVFA